jgi:hypothetical protein
MGFAKQEELDRLSREVELLKAKLVTGDRSQKKSSTKAAPKKSAAKKKSSTPVKKSAPRKKSSK